MSGLQTDTLILLVCEICSSISINTLSNVDAGETAPTPVTTVLSLQNLMDANKYLVLFNVI